MANKIIKAQMKQRRDTKANWAAQNPVLLAGELGIVSDDPNLYKVGDGATAWNSLPFRGFDGTLAQELGTSENAVISQKVVSEKLTELSAETSGLLPYTITDNLFYDTTRTEGQLDRINAFNRCVSIQLKSQLDVSVGASFQNGYAQVNLIANGEQQVRLLPSTGTFPYSADMFEDVWEEYEGTTIYFPYKVKVNWKRAIEQNASLSLSALVKSNDRMPQVSMYPFLGGKSIPLNLLRGIKDIYINGRDASKHYFISHCLTTTEHDTFQIRLSESNTKDVTNPSQYSNIFNVAIKKSLFSENDLKMPYLIEQNGHKLLVCFQELIDTGLNWEYYGTKTNPFSAASAVEFDWANIDIFSSLLPKEEIVDSSITASKIQSKAIEERHISDSALQYIQANVPTGSVTNNADEVTITSINNKLALKDKKATTSAMGRYVVATDTILTQELINSWGDSIIIIQADLLIKSNVSLKANSVYCFDGGSFVFDNQDIKVYATGAKIIAPTYQIFKNYGKFGVKWSAEYAHPEWFGGFGDGTTHCAAAMDACHKYIDAPIFLSSGKTYIMEASLDITGKIIGGQNAILKRKEVFVDIPIISDITSESQIVNGTIKVVVDKSHSDYSKLFVGMGTTIVNSPSTNRMVDGAYRRITEINDGVITLVGNSLANTYEAGTVHLTNNFTMLRLSDNAIIDNVVVDGSRESYAVDRVYWEASNCISINKGNNTTIQNCIIKNSVAEGVIGGGNNVFISHNLIAHCGANGIHLSGAYDWKIVNNTIFDTNLNPLTGHNEGAITYSNQCANITIRSNVFDTCRNGIGSIDSPDNCKSIITDNVFVNYRENGIQGQCVPVNGNTIMRSYVIANNRFFGKPNLHSWENSYNKDAYGEKTESTGYAILLQGYTGGTWEDVVISANCLYDSGVRIENCESFSMVGNAIVINALAQNYCIMTSKSFGSIVGNSIQSKSASEIKILTNTQGKISMVGNIAKGDVSDLAESEYVEKVGNVFVA